MGDVYTGDFVVCVGQPMSVELKFEPPAVQSSTSV